MGRQSRIWRCADAECPGSGAGRGCGSLGSCPSLAHRSLLLRAPLPALGVLRKHRGAFREARESCGSPRGGLARGLEVAVSPSGGSVTQRWRRSCPRPCGEAGGAPCAALGSSREREEFILLSCQSITSQRLLHRRLLLLPSSSPSLPALPDVLRAAGCKIPRAQAGESQHPLKLTREFRASPKPHQSDPRMRRVFVAGGEHSSSWCRFSAVSQFGVT